MFVQDDVIEVPAVAHGGGGGAVAVVPVPQAIETDIISFIHCNSLQGHYRVELTYKGIPVVITGNGFAVYMYQVTADFGTS